MVIDILDIKNGSVNFEYSSVELYVRNIPRNKKSPPKWPDAVTLNECRVPFSWNPYHDTYTKMTGIKSSIGICNKKVSGIGLVPNVSIFTVLNSKKYVDNFQIYRPPKLIKIISKIYSTTGLLVIFMSSYSTQNPCLLAVPRLLAVFRFLPR